MQFGSMFISNCNNALHVSDAFCVHPKGALKNCSDSLLQHVIHQRLSLQFLSAPEDECKKRPKHVE